MPQPSRLRDALVRAAPLAVATTVFLASRLLFLDSDVPALRLSQYGALDEFAYADPALNLVHYGSWIHQVAPWAPVEGWPMNVLQNIVTYASMQLLGYTYLGFRASSVAFGLVAFLGLLAVVRGVIDDARSAGTIGRRVAAVVTLLTAILLLVDVSSLFAGRIVEPTVSRVAALAVLIWLVSRGSLLGRKTGMGRTFVFGLLAGACVWFVYVYNLFVLPGAFLAVLVWAWSHGRWRSAARHGLAFGVGAVAATAAYFGLVLVVYDRSPLDWYQTWIATYDNSNRFEGATLGHLVSLLDANIFRLDRPFLLLFLVAVPAFAWFVQRERRPWAVLVGSLLGWFVVQSAFVADYPQRKFLVLIAFALPIVVAAIAIWPAFRRWLAQRRWWLAVYGVWVLAAVLITARRISLVSLTPTADLLLRGGAVAGIAMALAVIASEGRRGRSAITAIAGVALAAAILVPMLYLDYSFVYRHPTYAYRDTLLALRGELDGKRTAGPLAFAMQLYTGARPALNGYFYGIGGNEYVADVQRWFAEGGATILFEYDRPALRAAWEARGFRLVETYDMNLPNGWRMGRYVWAPP